jgi:hypothetical protein
MTPRALWLRRSRAVRCFAVQGADGDLAVCRPGGPDSKTKVIFESRDLARRAAEALKLVDPQGGSLSPTTCRLRNADGTRHFHLRSVAKVVAYKRRRRALKTSRGQDLGVTEGGQKMAEKTTEATTYDCDALKCGVEHVCVGVQEPKGIRLTAQLPYAKPVAVYACKPTHIRPAVEAVLNAKVVADARSDEERDADAAAQPADEEPEREEDGQDLSDAAAQRSESASTTDLDEAKESFAENFAGAAR